jgi:hypothetical protein
MTSLRSTPAFDDERDDSTEWTRPWWMRRVSLRADRLASARGNDGC